jgi:hypothetical protein
MSSREYYLEGACADYRLPCPVFSWISSFFRRQIQDSIASFQILNDSLFVIIYNIWRYKTPKVEEVVKQA